MVVGTADNFGSTTTEFWFVIGITQSQR